MGNFWNLCLWAVVLGLIFGGFWKVDDGWILGVSNANAKVAYLI
jgi:hypothetical protein